MSITRERALEIVEAELNAAWVKRGGGGAFESIEILPVGPDLVVHARWGSDSGTVGNVKTRRLHIDYWEWNLTLNGDEDFWIIQGSHDEKPPIPDAMIDFIVELENANL